MSGKRQAVRKGSRHYVIILFCLDCDGCCVRFMSSFTVTHHIVGTDTFRRAGQRSCHARAVLNSPVDCLKPRRHRRLVRAFCVAKSGWSAAEDSGVGYADHVAPKGNVSPPLMLFTNLAASPRRQPKKQRCFAQQRSLMAYTYVYIGFKSLYTLVYIVYVTHFVPYFTRSDFIVSYTKILFNVTLYTNVYIRQKACFRVLLLPSQLLIFKILAAIRESRLRLIS